MNEFCLTKDQTSPKSPPPHPSQVLPPSLEADANHVWIVDQLRNKKAPITLTARRKLVLVMFNWMQRIIEVFYSRIVYSTSR